MAHTKRTALLAGVAAALLAPPARGMTTDAWFRQGADYFDVGAPDARARGVAPGSRVARAAQRLRNRADFSPYYSQMGSKNTDTIEVLAGPEAVALNRGQSPGRFWTVRLGSHNFTISIEDSTKLKLSDVTGRIEKLTEPYRRALEIISEPGKNGIAFYSNLGGATAHGGQDYINIVPWGSTQVIAHEAGHVLEQRARNTEADILERWKDAIAADKVSVSAYGDHVAHEDQAEFALLWGVCHDAGNGRLGKLQQASPQRYHLWERMMALAGIRIATGSSTTAGPSTPTSTTPTTSTATAAARCPATDAASKVFVTFESVGAISSGEASLQDIRLGLQGAGGAAAATLSAWDPEDSGWTIFGRGASKWMKMYGYKRGGNRFDLYGDQEGIYKAVDITGLSGTLALTFALKFGGGSTNAARTYRASISIGNATASHETAIPCGSLVFQGAPTKPGHTTYRASALQVVLGAVATTTSAPVVSSSPSTPSTAALCGTPCTQNWTRGRRWLA